MQKNHRVHWYRQHTYGAVRWRCDICGDEEADIYAAGWNMALRAVLPQAVLEKLQAGESVDDVVDSLEVREETAADAGDRVEADATA